MANLEDLLAQQEQAMNKIYRMLPNFKKLGQANWRSAIIKQRLASLESAFAKCEELDLLIQRTATDTQRTSINYFVTNLFYRCEDIYQDTADFMAEAIGNLEAPTAANTSVSNNRAPSKPTAHLPQINLPSFDGSRTAWENFRDQFTSLIHGNASLSTCEKLHYLKSCVKGDALRALSHLIVTDANYDIAWKILVSRYENKRRLITEHILALMEFPTLKNESLRGLQNLRDTINASIQALRNLNRPVDAWPDVVIIIIGKKFDPKTRRAWETRLGTATEYPTYDELDSFLESRIHILEAIQDDSNQRTPPANDQRHPRSARFVSHFASPRTSRPQATHRKGASPHKAPTLRCSICGDSHQVYRCPMFTSLTVTQRLEIVEKHRLCVNCLSGSHAAEKCYSLNRCRDCNRRHHTLLHRFSTPNAELESQTTKPNQAQPATITSNTVAPISQLPEPVLLATARVRVSTSTGRWAIVRALLDQGSAATLLSENVAQLLRVQRRKCSVRIAGISGVEATARHTATIIISPAQGAPPRYAVNAIIMKSLTQYAPDHLKGPHQWDHTKNLRLADPDPFSSDPIDIIIGADLYIHVLQSGVLIGGDHEPGAQNTSFGWVLSGRVSSIGDTAVIPSLNVTLLDQLDTQIRQFWEIEELPSAPKLTPAEERCEEHFRRTHSRNEQGRYIVRLPFSSGKTPELGDSRTTAVLSLRSLERRMARDPVRESAYHEFMKEYEALGHMKRVSSVLQSRLPAYYIPHHAVFKQSSSTTNLRVVFNASAITTTGQSLNDHLDVGPKLQSDLSAIILRWRQFKVVLTADIEKMYRQILIHPDDADYQRILWRSSPDQPIEEFQLQTITYGTKSAPFLALRVLRQLTEDEGAKFPQAVTVMRSQTYVDDCIFGADDTGTALGIRDELIALLNKSGFRLRKWASNRQMLLQQLDPADHGLAFQKDFGPEESLQVLGLSWQPDPDVLRFRLQLPKDPGITKRQILSTIARFFDPLGWLTPVLITAKIYLQQLWTLRCDWDDAVPKSVQSNWIQFYAELSHLEKLTIPRWTGFSSKVEAWELHAFADASTTAYAAAIYVRLLPSTGPITTTLLIAKSKVAPLKTLSVPRLELCAAQLLARLVHYVTTTLDFRASAIYCWTDSTIVLAWIRQPPARWKTFVANRVASIQQLTATAIWQHVPTYDNPADCASRGILPTDIIRHSLWWSGPEWLHKTKAEWPASSRTEELDVSLEAKPTPIYHVAPIPASWNLPQRFSSWPKLLRVTALVYRFINRLRRAIDSNTAATCSEQSSGTGIVHPHEVHTAKIYWLKTIQRETFTSEIETLRSNHTLASSNTLSSFNPFLDSDGLLRVGGRLRHANLAHACKHPILLRSHPLLCLIIRHHHLQTLHGGTQLTLTSLRQEYWILRARTSVRSVIHQCLPCVRERAVTPSELMGDLPSVRVTRTARAFTHTGIDYAGPIAIRTAPGRGHQSHKAYIAIFVCMTVKAMHLELVSDYSSAAFIATYQRFVSRRGRPTALYSDNGTTFRGADKELRSAYAKALRDNTFLSQLATSGVQWNFLPPAAPHFGGLWEAGVKSVKYHLKRCIGGHTLTYEEMTTLLCQVEACLNSRPIAPLSDHFDDYSALTPGHFLIGAPLVASPHPSVLDCNEQRLSRWQLLQRLMEEVWRSWSSDYLLLLQQRPKWRVAQRLAKVGRLVLLRNPNAPPSRWDLGRIIACHPGDDGFTRVVTIKTSTSEYVRPIIKLCFLPVDVNNEETTKPLTAGGDPAVPVGTQAP